MAKISIIIPVYKCHEYLDRLLASIAMQDLTEGNTFETVLCDDCDGIGGYEKFVERWSPFMNIRLVKCPENLGPGGARTVGLRTCGDSDYIMFCDSDDALATDRAIEMLLNGIRAKDSDVCVARFIEELCDRTYNNHQPDMVWLFAKMYKNKFLKENNLEINNTRSNEDTGFNKLISLLTDKIDVIDGITYMWHYQPNTITRKDKHKYTYADGLRGSFWNHAWAFEEADKRKVRMEKLIPYMTDFLARGYFAIIEADTFDSAEHEANWNAAIDCYQRTLSELTKIGMVSEQDMINSFMKVNNATEHKGYPYCTYSDYLESLGFYKDLEALK